MEELLKKLADAFATNTACTAEDLTGITPLLKGAVIDPGFEALLPDAVKERASTLILAVDSFADDVAETIRTNIAASLQASTPPMPALTDTEASILNAYGSAAFGRDLDAKSAGRVPGAKKPQTAAEAEKVEAETGSGRKRKRGVDDEGGQEESTGRTTGDVAISVSMRVESIPGQPSLADPRWVVVRTELERMFADAEHSDSVRKQDGLAEIEEQYEQLSGGSKILERMYPFWIRDTAAGYIRDRRAGLHHSNPARFAALYGARKDEGHW